jgi:hypothetical protein
MGVWEFLPLGETVSIDPYLPLRAWRADDPAAVFALAGEAAAWHLGYLDRRFSGPVRVWLPEGARAPFGPRSHIGVVRLGWQASTAEHVGPDRTLLRRKRLDLSSGPQAYRRLGRRHYSRRCQFAPHRLSRGLILPRTSWTWRVTARWTGCSACWMANRQQRGSGPHICSTSAERKTRRTL